MKPTKRASRKSETQCLLFFSVALLLISPIETAEEHAVIQAPVSVANASVSEMRN